MILGMFMYETTTLSMVPPGNIVLFRILNYCKPINSFVGDHAPLNWRPSASTLLRIRIAGPNLVLKGFSLGECMTGRRD